MSRRARHTWYAALAVATISLAAASVAWACSSPSYGTPLIPAPPPTAPAVNPAAAPTGAAAAAPAPTTSSSTAPASSGAGAAAPTTSSAHTPIASGSTSGATKTGSSRRTTGTSVSLARPHPSVSQPRVSQPSASVAPAPSSAPAVPSSAPYGSGAIAVRVAGGTAGTTNVGGQSVFTSSIAPPRSHAAHHAVRASLARHMTAYRAPVAATRPAGTSRHGVASVAHPWTVAAPRHESSLIAAASSTGSHGGSSLSSQVLIGMLILGLGLTGLVGGALAVTVTRRRRFATSRVDRER